jgi:hypothetical protein
MKKHEAGGAQELDEVQPRLLQSQIPNHLCRLYISIHRGNPYPPHPPRVDVLDVLDHTFRSRLGLRV